MSAAAVLALLSLGPADATRTACRAEGVTASRCAEALRILAVESRGVAVGVHADARPDVPRRGGRVFWERAVERGLLRPDLCDEHGVAGPGDGAEEWGIRGPHGLAAAYSVHLVGECVPAAAVDVPFISAVITLRRLRVLERRHGMRTPEARALAWRIGVGAARARLPAWRTRW